MLGSLYRHMNVLLMHCSATYNDYFKNCDYIVIPVVQHKCTALHLPVDKTFTVFKTEPNRDASNRPFGLYRVLTSYLYAICLNLNKIVL